MKKLIRNFSFASVVLFWGLALAGENEIKDALTKAMPGVKFDSIKPSEIKGVYEVTVGANIFYASEDGKYLLQGHLINLASHIDVTEEKLSSVRTDSLDKVGEEKMVVFKPKIGKYMVSVFTDIDCGFCRKLHSEIDKYLAEGIKVRYLFFPRAGKGSDSYTKAVSVWCSEDRNAALTAAKKGTVPKEKTCDNPVDQHMQLAEAFEARGTPLIVTEKGNVLPGYVPAKQLAEILQQEQNQK